MSKTIDNIACPMCGSELTLGQLMSSEDTRHAFERLASVSIPLGSRVLQYTTLFTPPRTRLTLPKQIRLVLQLLPALERGVITHKGREWAAPLEAWSQAIDQMMLARDQGRLDLPMAGHGYLFAILAGMADKHEGSMEAQREVQRRQAPRQDTVQVRGQTMAIGDALQAQFGERDPALARIDAQAKAATPMPDNVRAKLAQLRKGSAS